MLRSRCVVTRGRYGSLAVDLGVRANVGYLSVTCHLSDNFSISRQNLLSYG